MSATNWLTTLLTGVLALAPQLVGVIPHPWNDVATAAIAFAGSLYHLFQETPK